MSGNKYTSHDYLKGLESIPPGLPQYDETHKYFTVIMTTTSMTLEALNSKYGKIGLRAVRILEMLSYTMSHDISAEHMFELSKNTLNKKAIQLLSDYRMCSVNGDKITVDRMVQEVLRTRNRMERKEEMVLGELVTMLKVIKGDFYSKSHITTAWRFASTFPNVLSKYYYRCSYSPLMILLSEYVYDEKTMLRMSIFEYKCGRHANIFKYLKYSLHKRDTYAVKHFHKLLEIGDYKFDVNELLYRSILIDLPVVTEYFFEKACDVNVVFKNGLTPLILACKFGVENLVIFLMESDKCDVNMKDPKGRTALFYACEKKSEKIVKKLIDCDRCDVNVQDRSGCTAFMAACRSGKTSHVKTLLENGDVDLSLRNKDGFDVFTFACKFSVPEVVHLLLNSKKFDLNAKDSAGCTLFMRACRHGKADNVKVLLGDDNVDVNAHDASGISALMYASMNKDPDMVKVLIENNKVDVHVQDAEGLNVLIYACKFGTVRIIENLAECARIDLNSCDGRGLTILMYACEYGRMEVVEALLKIEKLNLHKIDNEKRTALHWAALSSRRSKHEILDILMKRGCDPHAKDGNGKTPLDYSSECGDVEARLILQGKSLPSSYE